MHGAGTAAGVRPPELARPGRALPEPPGAASPTRGRARLAGSPVLRRAGGIDLGRSRGREPTRRRRRGGRETVRAAPGRAFVERSPRSAPILGRPDTHRVFGTEPACPNRTSREPTRGPGASRVEDDRAAAPAVSFPVRRWSSPLPVYRAPFIRHHPSLRPGSSICRTTSVPSVAAAT